MSIARHAAVILTVAALGLALLAAQGEREHAAATTQSAEVRLSTQQTLAGKLRREIVRARKAYARLKRDYRTLGLYVSPREAEWECIHRHEGAWDSDTNPIYDGGLQMDRSFQNTYGPEFVRKWGPANKWAVWAQKLAADRAWRVRGFSPWPNTARACGLL